MKKIVVGLFLISAVCCSMAQATPALPINSLTDSGFEVPSQSGGYRYISGFDSGWTYGGTGAGVAANGSAFGVLGATGSQAAFLQQGNASVSQDFTFFGAQFSVNFLGESRASYGGNPVAAYIDSILLTFSNANSVLPGTTNAFSFYTSDLITLSSGTHTLKFVGAGISNRDVTTFIDEVKITAVPEPTSIALLGLGLLGLVARRRTVKK